MRDTRYQNSGVLDLGRLNDVDWTSYYGKAVQGRPLVMFMSENPTGLGKIIAEELCKGGSGLVVVTTSLTLPRSIARNSGAKYDEMELNGGYEKPREVVEGELPEELKGLTYTSLEPKFITELGLKMAGLTVDIPRRHSG